MALSIAHLGPAGTFAEAAALLYSTWLNEQTQQEIILCPYPSIAQTIQATAQGQVDLAVVPVENSIEGSVTTTLDTLWRCDALQIQQALVLPISHAFMTKAKTIGSVKTVYSHPQALAQCHEWLEKFLPIAQIVSTNSTAEALQYLEDDWTAGAIASPRAAELYQAPVLACPINDHPDNCTRFWVLGLKPSPGGHCTSLAFTVHDVPGALLKPLQVFAQEGINLSKIESRPTKKSLGDYLFFVDLEADARESAVQEALKELSVQTETLKVFGSYDILLN
jgi:prephenate dehydratase